MTRKKPSHPSAITNRRARYDYELGDELVVGMELTGQEVRAARDGHVQLKGSYVNLTGGQLFLQNASFSLRLNEKGSTNARSIDTRPRRLLAKKAQIEMLAARKTQGMSIVPLRLLTGGRYLKLVIALGKGKKRYDKRHAIKQRDQEREVRRR